MIFTINLIFSFINILRLSVCFYPINVRTAVPIRLKFIEGLWMVKDEKFSIKILTFMIFENANI